MSPFLGQTMILRLVHDRRMSFDVVCEKVLLIEMSFEAICPDAAITSTVASFRFAVSNSAAVTDLALGPMISFM